MREYDEQYSLNDKPKRKHSDDPTTWAQAWQAIGIFMGLVIVAGLISNFLQISLFGDKIERYIEIVTTGNNSSNPLAGMANLYDSPVTLIIGLVFAVIIWLIGLFIIYGLSHFFATKLGGIGTMRGLIVRANMWMMISYGIMMVASLIGSWLLINNIVSYAASADMANTEAFNNYLFSQLQLSSSLYLGSWLIWGFGLSNVISKYYQIGQGKGCLAVIGTNLTLFVFYCAFTVALGASIYSAALR